MPKKVRRLLEQFQPENYQLQLALDRDQLTFSGRVVVRGRKTGVPSQRLTFHQKELKITEAKVVKHDKKGDQELTVERINNQDGLDEVRLHTESKLYPGDYTVTMEFSGKITPGMHGIYPCPFKHDGKDKMLLATHFESHHAREAFPCIDEPAAKASFDLTTITPKGEAVLSNTPVKQQKTEGERIVTTFETTPRMSSYLLAFVAGEMHSKQTKTKTGVEVRVWSTVSQPIESLDFATDTARDTVEFFEDYFGVPYPLAKSDHVALPDFSMGAMENWGLITYRERLLVAYPGEASQSTKEIIALVIGHETAHQWFGNLVTMQWWDDLWLNESFANMMEYQAVDGLFPEWDIWETFVSSEGLSALRRDSTDGVQSVKTGVNHPDEIHTLFDPSIVYAKGGRLLYMLKSYIGEEAFRRGLTDYFNKHAYGNTTGDDLWADLSKTSGMDVGAFMNPWLERSGFPVVTISQQDESVDISQEHFLDNPKKADPKRTWPVPLFPSSDDLPRRLDKSKLSCRVETSGLVRLNSGACGHYIVNYDSEWQRGELTDLVRSKKISGAERLMLLNDSSMLSKAGYRHFGDTLKLLDAYKGENDETVWGMIALVIAEARRFIDLDESLEPRIKDFVRRSIASEYKRLGWREKKGESVGDRKLRAMIIGLGAYAEEPSIIKQAKQLFADYKKDRSAIPAELRCDVFGVVIRQKVPGVFEYLLKLHDSTRNSDLKSDIAVAITLTRSTAEARKLLKRLPQPDTIKAQDADRWLIYLLRNRYSRKTAWDWMVANWAWVEETYGHEAIYDHTPRYSALVCNTEEWAKRYRLFFEPKQDQAALKRTILIAIEEIDNRVAWLKRDLPSVQQFFNKAWPAA